MLGWLNSIIFNRKCHKGQSVRFTLCLVFEISHLPFCKIFKTQQNSELTAAQKKKLEKNKLMDILNIKKLLLHDFFFALCPINWYIILSVSITDFNARHSISPALIMIKKWTASNKSWEFEHIFLLQCHFPYEKIVWIKFQCKTSRH